MFISVNFLTDSGPLPCKTSSVFGPFKVVEIGLKNTCPVCGAALSGTSCNCEGFTSKLTQLRTDYHDEEMYFHYGAFDLPIPCVFPLKDVLRIMVSDEEKQHLDWTNANWSVDDEKKCGFMIIGSSYNEMLGTVIFYYKRIEDPEHVWKGVVSMVDLKMPKIYFGKYISPKTPNLFGKMSGGHYKDVCVFDDLTEVFMSTIE